MGEKRLAVLAGWARMVCVPLTHLEIAMFPTTNALMDSLQSQHDNLECWLLVDECRERAAKELAPIRELIDAIRDAAWTAASPL